MYQGISQNDLNEVGLLFLKYQTLKDEVLKMDNEIHELSVALYRTEENKAYAERLEKVKYSLRETLKKSELRNYDFLVHKEAICPGCRKHIKI